MHFLVSDELCNRRLRGHNQQSLLYQFSAGKTVAVGTTLTGGPRTDPSERHYRTGLLPWVFGEEAVVRHRMHNPGVWDPMADDFSEPVPVHPMPLTPPAQCMQPVSADLGPEDQDCLLVAGDRVIVVITTHDPSQPNPDCGHRFVSATQQRLLDLGQFGPQAFLHRLAPHDKPLALSGFPTHMGETQEIKGFRLALSAGLSVASGKPSAKSA